MEITQTPAPGERLLRWRGDTLHVVLTTGCESGALGTTRPTDAGRAAFRTTVGSAKTLRRETIAPGSTPAGAGWRDMPMRETAPGRFELDVPLDETGVFSGKACYFPPGSDEPLWPAGGDLHVKTCPAWTRGRNSIYTVFPRQFGSFREVVRRLPHIMDAMGFGIVQTLPPFPVPATYAVMGEYGCPFAATDFFDVDPAMAEFDAKATPFAQFVELIDAVHSRRGRFFIDLPANHTGWASALQTAHPEWFKHGADGSFVSPGAWGVTWEDLVELDYANEGLRRYMAEVFLFWCRNGADGFRCDAGYMLPLSAWEYIVARVRDEYPDTVFMLEGLGGDPAVTDALLSRAGLDWAYSELFQTYDRDAFAAYLPDAARRSSSLGTLVHFAETHDNDRLAAKGETYARLRVQLAALLSLQGAWGITNGVEWFCREKIDVHGKNGLCFGAERNMVPLVSRLNALVASHPTFRGECRLSVIVRGGGNTLAVLRESGGLGTSRPTRVLVLANLDCEKPAAIDWDPDAFPCGEAVDLMSGERIGLQRPFALQPGEVRCFEPAAAAAPVGRAACPQAADNEASAPAAVFRWSWPADAKRDLAVPAGETVFAESKHLFRLDVCDGADGRTLCAVHDARLCGDGLWRASFAAPEYAGDGTRCRELCMKATAWDGGEARRTSSRLLVPPPGEEAKAVLSLDGEAIRRDPLRRTVLANGAGAMAQMRVGWGGIASQYDALLSANTDPARPSDRINTVARLRCWVRSEGSSIALDARSAVRFAADPSGRTARWEFAACFGADGPVRFAIDVSLAEGRNAAIAVFSRTGGGSPDRRVRVIARPDLEWRSWHDTTKASAGPETLFPASIRARSGGFDFSPCGGTLSADVAGEGAFHKEPEWQYCVSHAEEAERGQEPCGDLFSPGWFSIPLADGESARIAFSTEGPAAGLRTAERRPATAAEASQAPLPVALAKALDLFIARRDGLKTVIAGFPWFLDWGRDTFIFMRGMIAAGKTAESLAILEAFAAFEEKGTLPNIIHGRTAGNRDTSDAPLWFVRCVKELEEKGADVSKLRKACENIVEGYIAGTPNGISVDAESALVRSPSHFTWMDTNYPACTPREGYPVEIQALWISALEWTGRKKPAAKARASVERLFPREGGGYCDCLLAPAGVSAAAAKKDASLRPNQLFLATLGILDDPGIALSCAPLAIPGAMRTLDAADPAYRGVYAGDEDTRRKPAYHNGTAWGWLFPSYVEALAATGAISRPAALSLLASAVENLNADGCVAHMSEIADGDAPHAQKGCTAQAWSESELLRVWLALA